MGQEKESFRFCYKENFQEVLRELDSCREIRKEWEKDNKKTSISEISNLFSRVYFLSP